MLTKGARAPIEPIDMLRVATAALSRSNGAWIRASWVTVIIDWPTMVAVEHVSLAAFRAERKMPMYGEDAWRGDLRLS
jgi:hypothetical protein